MVAPHKLRARIGCRAPWLAIAACLPASIHAQSTTVAGTVALSSQLVDRGQAITPVTPVLQGDVSLTLPAGWSLDASASTETRSPGRLAGASAQLSHTAPLSPDWQMQADLAYYDYPGGHGLLSYDRVEAGLGWSYRDVLTLGLSMLYAVGTGDHRPRGAVDLGFHWPLQPHLWFSAGAGVSQTSSTLYRHRAPTNAISYDEYYVDYDERSRSKTYGYGHLGLIWGSGPWRVELDRIFTNQQPHQRQEPDTAPWVATLSFSF